MELELHELEVEIEFIDEILGSQPSNEEVYTNFIATKIPEENLSEAEKQKMAIRTVEEGVEKGTTIFPVNENGEFFVYGYQIRGFFKSACQSYKNVPSSLSSKVKAHKKLVDTHIFIKDNENVFYSPTNEEIKTSINERPLRASTMQGERVALARSESLPAGIRCRFVVQTLLESELDLVKEWLSYGKLNGLGQWRNSGKGRFVVLSYDGKPYVKSDKPKKAKRRVIEETGEIIED